MINPLYAILLIPAVAVVVLVLALGNDGIRNESQTGDGHAGRENMV